MNALRRFLEFIGQSQFRFYQERDLGLDLYHNGVPGIALALLTTTLGVVFLLAIFHVIPRKGHVVRLLLGLGGTAFLLGVALSFFNWTNLSEIAPRIIRDSAGPLPANESQTAAIVALPLVLGALDLVAGTLGCLYMAIFWGSGMTEKKREKRSRSGAANN